ncbi:hypothetical protein [Aureimonas jatrophae]|uniref:Uncharacterized protein n=1 Tax=Aureimonas jatrophae TaxID=1166073 RepID=A0A1H0DDW1_9HYPH|nr:hypothetical protein [Aureimonas jatrophae]MBB3951828.1 hypothetical protein [Aureimonas jatrophae]SDN68131.1 hypothetical protein SAMN05192530_101721 [Aureimonas jatrophae]
MDHHKRTDLLLMALDLRLAARAPSEHLGQRLTPQRLQDMAAALEEVAQTWAVWGESPAGRPANDAALTARAGTVIKLQGRG